MASTRIVVVTDTFPQETFVVRHVRGLEADVVSQFWNPKGFSLLKTKPQFTSLFDVKKRKLTTRIFFRAKELAFGVQASRWPRAMEHVWKHYIITRNPDVVLAEFAPNGMKILESCRRYRLPLVVHFHGYDATSLLRFKRYVNKLPDLFAQAFAIVGVSNIMREVLIELGCPQEKISIIPCGAPINKFSISDRVSAPHCRFIFVGRLIQVKGPLLLLRAFKRCAELNSDISLCMIGGGPLYKKVFRFIRKHRLENKVVLLGQIPVDRVQAEMAKSSVLVQPSILTRIGHLEAGGPPVSVAEGAASGLPCIAFKTGGIPDFIKDGINGYLVTEGDWEALADRMAQLAKNPEIRKQMGEENRRAAELNANTSIQIEKLKRLLLNAVKTKGKSKELG